MIDLRCKLTFYAKKHSLSWKLTQTCVEMKFEPTVLGGMTFPYVFEFESWFYKLFLNAQIREI